MRELFHYLRSQNLLREKTKYDSYWRVSVFMSSIHMTIMLFVHKSVLMMHEDDEIISSRVFAVFKLLTLWSHRGRIQDSF